MAAREHLFEVAEVGHHCHDVVLHVAQVEPDLTARRDGVGFVAALGEAFDHVGLAAEQAHKGHDFLAALADLAE